MFGKLFYSLVWVVIFPGVSLLVSGTAFSFVERAEGRTYIVDQRGEKWDVTQAESIGFKPDRFQFGIGRNAFTPLDGSALKEPADNVPDNLRILGIKKGSEAQAYSIPKLRWHEIANSRIGSEPVVVGF